MNALRQLIREIILNEFMTTTPAMSWSSATPLGPRDEDPWSVEYNGEGPCTPAKNMGGHSGGNEDHTTLGDDEKISVFNGDDPEEWETSDWYDHGYWSSPTMQRDR